MQNVLKMSLLSIIIAAGVSCTKENTTSSNNSGTEKNLIGEWKMTSYEQSGESKVSGQVVSTNTVSGSNFSGSIDLKSDHTFTSDVGYDATVITTIPGFGSDTVTTSVYGFSSSGTWKVNSDGDLEFTADGQTNSMEIASSSSSKMVLKVNINKTQTVQGTQATTTAVGSITLEK